MNRRLLLSLVSLAIIGLWASPQGARADRLGGNYRGPGDIYVVHEDPAAPAAGAGSGGGGSSAPTDGGTGSGTGDSGGTAPPPDSGGSPPPDSGGGSSAPPDSGGGGGSTSGGDSAPPPESGGGGTTGSGAGGTSGSSPSAAGGGGGTGGSKGKGASADDKDKIWPFYFEGAKEEYVAQVLARRPVARIAPKGSSSYLLSTLPEPASERRLIGDTDRQEASALVMARLQDPDSHVRDAAVLALGKGGFKDALPFLQKVADGDSDAAVREDALLALGLSGQSDVALPVLLKALASNASDKRERRVAYAALGLGLLGKSEGAVEPLRKVYQTASLRADQADTATCAAVALGMLGDGEALPLFEKTMGSRVASEAVKSFTIHAMGKYGSVADEKVRKAALKGILEALQEGKDTIREAAILALGSFDDAAVIPILVKEGLNRPDVYGRNFAAHSLGRIAGRAGPTSREYALIAKELAKVAEDEKKDRWLFQAGTMALASMSCSDHEKVLTERMGELSKMNAHSASSVILALGLMGSDSPALLKQLDTVFTSKSSGVTTQAYAGLALALNGAPGTAKGLTTALTGETKPGADMARTAALALGLVGGNTETKLLVNIITGASAEQQAISSRFFMKGAAVQGLGLIGDADSVKLLKPALDSKDWEVRAFATAALGYLMEGDARHRITPRISDIFRHHNYHIATGVVKQVQGTL